MHVPGRVPGRGSKSERSLILSNMKFLFNFRVSVVDGTTTPTGETRGSLRSSLKATTPPLFLTAAVKNPGNVGVERILP